MFGRLQYFESGTHGPIRHNSIKRSHNSNEDAITGRGAYTSTAIYVNK